jgi:hypothetical protein
MPKRYRCKTTYKISQRQLFVYLIWRWRHCSRKFIAVSKRMLQYNFYRVFQFTHHVTGASPGSQSVVQLLLRTVYTVRCSFERSKECDKKAVVWRECVAKSTVPASVVCPLSLNDSRQSILYRYNCLFLLFYVLFLLSIL